MSGALLRLRQENFTPNHALIPALTAGEDGGPDYYGVQQPLTNHRELVNASLWLNADAGGAEKRHGRLRMYTGQAAEKVYLSFRLEAIRDGIPLSSPRRTRSQSGFSHLLPWVLRVERSIIQHTSRLLVKGH